MIYLLLGILVGFLSGLFGIGGGILVAPALVFIFQQEAFFLDHTTQIAAGSSLAVIVFTALVSIIAYQKRKSIDWKLVKQLLPGIVVGSLLGTMAATLVSSEFLGRFLGFWVFLMSVQMMLPENNLGQKALPDTWVLVLTGVFAGIIGGLVGLGGGILLVPFLSWYQIPLRVVAGTVVTCSFFVALTGIVNLTLIPHLLPHLRSSYIFWPAVWHIVPTSIVFAWIGASVAHQLPAVIMKRIFAVFLALVGIYLIFLH